MSAVLSFRGNEGVTELAGSSKSSLTRSAVLSLTENEEGSQTNLLFAVAGYHILYLEGMVLRRPLGCDEKIKVPNLIPPASN